MLVSILSRLSIEAVNLETWLSVVDRDSVYSWLRGWQLAMGVRRRRDVSLSPRTFNF